MITVEQLVNREVHYCASHLVSTLAGGYGAIENTDRLHSRGRDAQAALSELTEQAMELCSPIEDWEEAATQEGWEMDGGNIAHKSRDGNNTGDDEEYADDWREACEISAIEPYQREVFEHWIVSDWLADKLEAKGEKVGKDFAGMIIWARTCTGQGIANDSVIIAIHADLQTA